jgi:hypothetical protein
MWYMDCHNELTLANVHESLADIEDKGPNLVVRSAHCRYDSENVSVNVRSRLCQFWSVSAVSQSALWFPLLLSRL